MRRTKKETAAYRAAALDILRRFGAQTDPESHYPYTIETQAGPLRLSVHSDCICTRFDDVARAKALELGGHLNPYSGKWNWMGGMTHEGDMVDLAYFQQALRRVLQHSPTPNPELPLLPFED